MSSVGVMTQKKSKCPKKNFQSVKRGKNVRVEFRVFGKKNGNWKKSSGKEKFFGGNLKWKILLSSCSLVGLYVNLQVKVTGKKMLKIFKVFFGWVLEVKFAICLGNLKFFFFKKKKKKEMLELWVSP